MRSTASGRIARRGSTPGGGDGGTCVTARHPCGQAVNRGMAGRSSNVLHPLPRPDDPDQLQRIVVPRPRDDGGAPAGPQGHIARHSPGLGARAGVKPFCANRLDGDSVSLDRAPPAAACASTPAALPGRRCRAPTRTSVHGRIPMPRCASTSQGCSRRAATHWPGGSRCWASRWSAFRPSRLTPACAQVPSPWHAMPGTSPTTPLLGSTRDRRSHRPLLRSQRSEWPGHRALWARPAGG